MTAHILRGDARHLPLPDASVDLIVTSPPYFGLRSYSDNGVHYDGQIGSEATPREWLAAMLECTAEWVRVLKPSGSMFVNLGDKYSGNETGGRLEPSGSTLNNPASMPRQQQNRTPYRSGMRPKSLLGLPWRYALACMDDLGLILRRDIIWSKPNGLPESVTDRCRSSHEYLFHLVKQPRYYAAVDEIREDYSPNKPWGAAQRGPSKPSLATAAIRGSAPSQQQGGLSKNKERVDNPLGKLPGSVWDIPSQPLTVPAWLGVDHFAAFPMELPRRIILGWSPPGICVACGEGRRPVVDKRYVKGQSGVSGFKKDGREPLGRLNGTGMAGKPAMDVQATITGYACACPDATAPTRPSVVVDPFGGTGTTALVADVYGRDGLSFDLSADYCRLARWRTRDPAERAKALQVAKPPPVTSGQGDLFEAIL